MTSHARLSVKYVINHHTEKLHGLVLQLHVARSPLTKTSDQEYALIDLIHNARQLRSRFRINGITAISRGISGGKQKKKLVNARNRGRLCVFSQNEEMIKSSSKMYGLSFDKINVIIACCKDIYGRYCIQKSTNDHFHRDP